MTQLQKAAYIGMKQGAGVRKEGLTTHHSVQYRQEDVQEDGVVKIDVQRQAWAAHGWTEDPLDKTRHSAWHA